MNRTLLILGGILWVVGTGLYLTSMLTRFWIQSESGLSNFGLFQACEASICENWGWDISSLPARIIIPRILLLIGAGFISVGMLIGSIGICLKTVHMIIVSGIFHLIADADGWMKQPRLKNSSMYSYYMKSDR